MTANRKLDELSPHVREVGLQRRDSWRTKPRRIYDHQFLYCFMGTAHINVEDRYYPILERDVVIIPPDTPHAFWVEEQQAGELYWFHCDLFFHDDGSWIYDYYNTPETYVRLFNAELNHREHIRVSPVFENGYRLPEHLSFPHNDDVDLIFRSLYKLYTRKDARFPLTSKVLVLQLIEAVLAESGYYRHQAVEHSRVSDVIQNYIQNNYFRKLSVREICQCTQMHPDYAGKLFKKETGMSLIDYLNHFRIQKAKRLLLDADLSIADVAEMVGFSNENYFCSVARKVEGKTPAKMRQQLLSLIDQ